MLPKPLFFFTTILVILLFSSCKFYFNESEYLGTYSGNFDSEIGFYQDCNGQAILTDVGNNKVNIELLSDANPTFYYTNLTVERGFFLRGEELQMYADGLKVIVNRNDHSLQLHYNSNPSYYDFHFYGSRL